MMKLVSLAPFLVALTQAADLDKPALTSDLDYLLPGNTQNLPSTQASWEQWGAGYIPADCKSLAEGQSLNPSDFEVYNVFYSDCGDPWVFCRHKDSSDDLGTMVNTFSKVPVRMRNWVRHVLTIPGNNWAFNSNGNIAFSGTTSQNVDVALHETAHSTDLLGAFGGAALSSSQEWLDAYNKDSNVPDNYAQSNQVENVAQNTVVAVYDKNNPGGFPGIQPGYQGIINQYSLVEQKASDILQPGGACDRKLANSETVTLPGAARSRSTVRRVYKPDTSFKGSYSGIVKDFTPFSTEGNCNLCHS